MLVNPLLDKLVVIPGTRLLEDPILTPGCYVTDYREPWRHWSFQWMLAPVPGRRLGGVRARVVDHKGFISFINQRDLEVTLGHGKPGGWCSWLGQSYLSPTDPEWYGVCCDDEDLRDDLFEHECRLREQYAGYPWLPAGLEVTRRVHLEQGNDVEELQTLLWDMDPDSRQYPDPRLDTVQRRWARVERRKMDWSKLP